MGVGIWYDEEAEAERCMLRAEGGGEAYIAAWSKCSCTGLGERISWMSEGEGDATGCARLGYVGVSVLGPAIFCELEGEGVVVET